MTIFDKYNAAGLIPFSFNIDVHEQTRTKIFKDIPTFGIYKKFNKKNIDETKNGHGVIMGTKQGDKYIIGLDIDNKPGIYDGLEKWKALLNKHYKLKNENDDILFHFDTPTQKTGTNGYHYLFLVSQEQLKIIGCSITGLYIDDSDDKYKIDIKATNQFLACEPSNYDGKIYKWIKAPHETAIINIPNWIFNIIVKHKENKPKAQPKEKATPKQQEEQKPLIINKVDNNLYKYLECLDQTRYNNYDNWVNIGRILKNNNIPFEYYLEKSRKAKNFISDDDVLKKWTTFKTQKYSLKSIYWMAKFDNVEQFNKITSLILTMDNINTLFDISKYPQLKINKQYLLNNDNDDNIINKYIDDWQTKDIKTLNIKSKYGSGKTQLLKNILTKYKPKRVLWLTYRQTLTDNIEDEFIKFGFKSYLDHITDADRQILQLESIHKLYLNENDEDDEFNDNDDEKKRIIPKYDLIILDEIESILNHFNSTTFSKKHNSEEAFEDLLDIINASTKLITLDGDLNNRALKYASNFGKMLTINNEYNINERKFNFITDEDIFKNSLLKDIDRAIKENKKIAICSMSKTDTIKYNDILLAHNKDLKILLINADTDDEDKKKMKHIKQYIINYDVFIYSPSIEAGVNIDIVDMFNNLYCIVCGGSTSPRSFLQMTARIRHLNNNNINILNHSLNNNKCNNYWEFEEVKNMLNNSHELRMRRETKTEEDKTFTIFKMTPYSETYIYNKLEKLNNNSYYFINLLCLYCKQKGIETIFNEEQERTYIKLDKDEYFERIIKLKTIDKDENNELQRKINNRTASRDEKLQQSKYFYLAFLCVDKLNVDIMNAFYKQLEPIKNFIKLIDDVKINNASIIYEKFDKIKIVKSIIANMGFCHVFDKDTIHQDKFKIKIDAIRTEHPEYFSKETRALFNMAKFKTDTTTDKAILGHINSLLRNFSIQIKATRQREYGKTNLISFYGLEHLNNVDEILYYKMQKGRPVVDINNIIKIDTKKFIYNDLINKHDDKDINKKIVDIGNLDNGLIFDDDDIIDELNKLEIDLTDY